MRKMIASAHWFGTVACGVAFGLLASPAVRAQDDATSGEKWQFEITPYLFAAGLDGTVGVRGVTANIDVSFSDLLKNIDSGFMGLFEARKGRWTFGLDAVYTKLKVDESRSWEGPLGNGNTAALNATMTEEVYQPFVGYRVLNERTKVDLIGGARYTKLASELNLSITTGAALLPDGSRGVSGSKSWWDPVIGVRVLAPIADSWSLLGYADVGGGGGGDTDFTYQLVAGVNWDFAKQYSAKFGYRYLYQDYAKGGVTWDVAMQGVYLGLGIRF
jgi:opacity protein-like surface antigen